MLYVWLGEKSDELFTWSCEHYNLGYKCASSAKLWSCFKRMFIYNIHDIIYYIHYISYIIMLYGVNGASVEFYQLSKCQNLFTNHSKNP